MDTPNGFAGGTTGASLSARDALRQGLQRALAALGSARLAGVAGALLEVPAWELLVLLGVLAVLVGLILLEWHPLRGIIGDPPTLTHHPKSPAAKLIRDHVPLPRFWPTFWLCSPHWQTCFLHFFARAPRVQYRRELVTTPDGGTLALDWVESFSGQEQPQAAATAAGLGKETQAAEAQEGAAGAGSEGPTPLAILIPGLSSDSKNQYVKHCAAALARLGWNVVVLNHRGLGGVKITSRRLYNAGFTTDMHLVVDLLSQRHPGAPLYAVGTSLGANVLVKYLGEQGAQGKVHAAVAICCPWDLLLCDRWMNRSLPQRVYNTALAFSLKAFAFKHRDVLKEMVCMRSLSKSRSIRQFDENVTTIAGNFETVDTYYRRCSCLLSLPEVQVPTLCVSSLDDPICTSEALPWAECRANPNMVLLTTRHGGHLAYLQGLTAGTIWWADITAKFLQAAHLRPPPQLLPLNPRVPSQVSFAVVGDLAAKAALEERQALSRPGPRKPSFFEALGASEGSSARDLAELGRLGNQGSSMPSGVLATGGATVPAAPPRVGSAGAPAGAVEGQPPPARAGGGTPGTVLLNLPCSAGDQEALGLLEQLLLQLLVAVRQRGTAVPAPAQSREAAPQHQKVKTQPAYFLSNDAPKPEARERGPAAAPATLDPGLKSVVGEALKQHLHRSKGRDTVLLLLHATIAVAGPLAAAALAWRLQRLRH